MAGFFFQSPFPSGHCLSVLASGLCSLSPQSICLPELWGTLSLLSGISPDTHFLLPVPLLKLLRQSKVPKPQLLLTLSLYSSHGPDSTIPILHIPGHSMLPRVTAISLFQCKEACTNITPLIPILSLTLCSALKVNALPSLRCFGNWQKQPRSTERTGSQPPAVNQMGKLVHLVKKLMLMASALQDVRWQLHTHPGCRKCTGNLSGLQLVG